MNFIIALKEMEIPRFLRGLKWTAGITIEKMRKMVLLKNKTHQFEIDGFGCYFTIFILVSNVPFEIERK